MWTIVYIARDKEMSDKIRVALNENGIIFKIREIGNDGSDDICYEFLVPDAEVEQAHGIIIDIGF